MRGSLAVPLGSGATHSSEPDTGLLYETRVGFLHAGVKSNRLIVDNVPNTGVETEIETRDAGSQRDI